MAKEQTDVVVEKKSKWASIKEFTVKNRKMIEIISSVVLVLVLAIVAWCYIVNPHLNKKAQEKIYPAVLAFEAGDYEMALPVFDSISGSFWYKWTDAAKLSKMYSGFIYFEQGDYAKSRSLLEDVKFDKGETLMTSAIKSKIGDCYVNEGNYKEAVKFFEEAIKISTDPVCTPRYMVKAARVYEAMGNKGKALSLYQSVKAGYPWAEDINKIDAYIERCK